MGSSNGWFSSKEGAGLGSAAATDGGFTSTISSAGKGFTGQVKSMGTAMSSAMGKAKEEARKVLVRAQREAEQQRLVRLAARQVHHAVGRVHRDEPLERRLTGLRVANHQVARRSSRRGNHLPAKSAPLHVNLHDDVCCDACARDRCSLESDAIRRRRHAF